MQTSPDSVREALEDTEYPAEKRDLVKHAKMHGASKDVLDDHQKSSRQSVHQRFRCK